MLQPNYQRPCAQIIDEIDRGRAQQYALLATLLSRSPDAGLISRLHFSRVMQARLETRSPQLAQRPRARMKMN